MCISISQEQWGKTNAILTCIAAELHTHGFFHHKTLERHCGFLVYISQTYPAMVPYLNGIHLMLDSWRPWHRHDGWKINTHDVAAALQERGLDPHLCLTMPP